MNVPGRPDPDRPPDEDDFVSPRAEGRVWLASGWWNWFTGIVPTPGFWESNERWLLFRHHEHKEWSLRVKVDASWDGSPTPLEFARAVMSLMVEEETPIELFVMNDHVFLQRGKGDVGVLIPYDGRALAELREDEIATMIARARRERT